MKEKTDSFASQLLTLVFPIAFQQFMLALVSASDTFMLGALAQDALSAVSLASQIAFVENLFLAAMTIGLSMLAAQYWGKGNRAAVEKILAYVLRVSLLISCVFFLAGLLVPQGIMRIFTNDPGMLADGAVYLRTVSPSFLLTAISQVFLCTLKNSGRAGQASLISSVGVVVNIALNALLIFGLVGFPRLEIAGAATATVIARLMEVTWCILESTRKNSIRLRFSFLLRPEQSLRRQFWTYTLPVLGNEIVWGVGFTMSSVIMGHLGSDAVAANSIASVVKNLAACFCVGLGSGGGIMVGNQLGAGQTSLAKEYGKKLCRMSILCGVASGLLILLLRPAVLSVTTLSGQANRYLNWMLVMCSYYMVGKSVNSTTISGIFCAGGDSKFGFLCDAVTLWCIIVPAGFAAAFLFHLPVLVVYFVLSLDEMIKLPAVYRNYKKYRWVKDLTTKEHDL